MVLEFLGLALDGLLDGLASDGRRDDGDREDSEVSEQPVLDELDRRRDGDTLAPPVQSMVGHAGQVSVQLGARRGLLSIIAAAVIGASLASFAAAADRAEADGWRAPPWCRTIGEAGSWPFEAAPRGGQILNMFRICQSRSGDAVEAPISEPNVGLSVGLARLPSRRHRGWSAGDTTVGNGPLGQPQLGRHHRVSY
jgi:hypothetical protein